MSVGGESASGRQPTYSIGAVASMLGIETATLRAWEERYGLVVPARSAGGQRVYSRDELEQLRFVVDHVAAGATAGDAHRLLAGRSSDAEDRSNSNPGDVRIGVLLAERDRYSAELLEYLLRTEGYEVSVGLEPARAEELFAQRRPHLVIVELMMSGGGLELCARLARGDAPVLAMSPVDLADQAMEAGASAFLTKPVSPLVFVATVRDLLGSSALTRRAPGPVA